MHCRSIVELSAVANGALKRQVILDQTLYIKLCELQSPEWKGLWIVCKYAHLILSLIIEVRAPEQGADFIECDVVLTKDCHPICRHEPDISQTTDAIAKFPNHRKNLTIDGVAYQQARLMFAIQVSYCRIRGLALVGTLLVQCWPSRYSVIILANAICPHLFMRLAYNAGSYSGMSDLI